MWISKKQQPATQETKISIQSIENYNYVATEMTVVI